VNLVYDSSFDAHKITPKADTARRLDGSPADLLDPRSYPVVAECLECGRTVRVEAYFFSDWEHLDDPQT
jgi:hypothetical protein